MFLSLKQNWFHSNRSSGAFDIKEKVKEEKEERGKGPAGRPGQPPAHPVETGPGTGAIRAASRGPRRPIRPKCRSPTGPPGCFPGPTGLSTGWASPPARPHAYLPPTRVVLLPGCWAGPTGRATGLISAKSGRPAWQPAGLFFWPVFLPVFFVFFPNGFICPLATNTPSSTLSK